MSNPENLEGKGFKDNPQNINRNGRPRKSFRLINDKLKEDGIEPLKKAELIEGYSLIFNSTEDDLKSLAKDKDTPYALKIMILELNDRRARARALQDYRDYMFGKAQDKVDLTTNGKDINIINLGTGTKPE